MKKLLKYIGSLFCLLIFAAQVNAQTPNVSLTIACPGSVISGTSINVNASYGYGNIVGNITVTVNYDNTKVNFLNSSGFAILPTSYTNPLTPGITTLTYVIPASGGINQTGAIQLHFTAICPQTCFGVTNISNFSGNISAPGATTVTSNTCGTNLNVINDWGGYIYSTNYNCKLNQLTFNVYVKKSSCYVIYNPTVTVSSSVGTLLSSNVGTVAGSTITLPSPLLNTSDFYFSYTIQLPCAAAGGTSAFTSGTVNTTAILNGDNCGTYTPNLKSYTYSYVVAPQNSVASLSCSASYPNKYILTVSNNGLVPINANLSTLLPNLNYTSFTHSTTQSTPLSGTYQTYDCSSTSSGSSPFTSSTITSSPVTIGTIKKIDYTILNLAPGKSFTMVINYSGTSPSCSPAATLPYTFSTSGNYTGIPSASDCNCVGALKNFTGSNCSFDIIVQVPAPNIYCNQNSSYNNTLCHRAGEVVSFCLYLRNNGNDALANGVINLALPTYLNLNTSSVTYDGLTTGISATPGGIVTLPVSIPQGVSHVVCFTATINTTAPNGLHTYNPTITGSNMSVRALCEYKVLICQDPKAEISKLVKGSEDTGFSTSGSAMAGTTATYQITVTNSGNTPISSIEILDRLPQTGDKTIRNCSPRGSTFSVLPTGVFSPSTLASAASYSNSASGMNNVPTTWLGGLAGFPCDVSGSFTAGPKNTVYVNLPNPILPFSSYSFEMQVQIPATAKGGDQICNTVALKTNYQDETGAEYPLEIIESDKVCLIVAPPPCKPCPEMVKSETVTMNPGTTSPVGMPYVVKTGYVTITTIKPVQVIHINIADLKYHFNKPECKDCKTPALSRGGIFPLSTTQTVGSLVWDDYTGSSIPSTTPLDNLPQELIWNLGVMLPAGTYTIPFQITLPQSIIPDCCELIIDQFALKVSLKDVDCNVCENFVKPSNDNCCTGSYWESKQMVWSLLTDTSHDVPRDRLGTQNVRKSELAEALTFNKSIKDQLIFANVKPINEVIKVECDKTYRITVGKTWAFKAVYKCNPNMKNCESQSLVSITTLGGYPVNVVNQPMPYNHNFSQPGTYRIKYVGKCGGIVCNTCEYILIVEKNCCADIVKFDKTTITTQNIRGTSTSAITSTSQHFTSFGKATVNLNYSCAKECGSTYSWVKKRNGVIIGSGISSSSSIDFDPPTSGEYLIEITVVCGGQKCDKIERFYLGCSPCLHEQGSTTSTKIGLG